MSSLSEFSKSTSEKLNVDFSVVKKINTFYWDAVKKAISSGEYRTVEVKNLFIFTAAITSVRVEIHNAIDKIRTCRLSNILREQQKIDILDVYYKILRNCLKIRNEYATQLFTERLKRKKQYEQMERVPEANS